jgi:hypothetical protein
LHSGFRPSLCSLDPTTTCWKLCVSGDSWLLNDNALSPAVGAEKVLTIRSSRSSVWTIEKGKCSGKVNAHRVGTESGRSSREKKTCCRGRD